MLCFIDTYDRCPYNVNSYYYECYPIFAQETNYHGVYETCIDFGGLPVWFNTTAEFEWLKTRLQSYLRNCFHIGNFRFVSAATQNLNSFESVIN